MMNTANILFSKFSDGVFVSFVPGQARRWNAPCFSLTLHTDEDPRNDIIAYDLFMFMVNER